MIKTTAFIIQSQGFVPPKKGTENTEILFFIVFVLVQFCPHITLKCAVNVRILN